MMDGEPSTSKICEWALSEPHSKAPFTIISGILSILPRWPFFDL